MGIELYLWLLRISNLRQSLTPNFFYMDFDLTLVILNFIKIRKEWKWLPMEIEPGQTMNIMQDAKKKGHF